MSEDEYTQADYLDELEAQVETHGFQKLTFFLDTAGEGMPLDLSEIRFDGENIVVTFI